MNKKRFFGLINVWDDVSTDDEKKDLDKENFQLKEQLEKEKVERLRAEQQVEEVKRIKAEQEANDKKELLSRESHKKQLLADKEKKLLKANKDKQKDDETIVSRVKRDKENATKLSKKGLFGFFNRKETEIVNDSEYERILTKRYKKRKRNIKITRIVFILFVLFASIRSLQSTLDQNNYYIEQEFIKQYVNAINLADNNSITSVVESYSLDHENVVERDSFRLIHIDEIVSREELNDRVNYIVLVSILNKSNKTNRQMMKISLRKEETKFVVLENFTLIDLSDLKVSEDKMSSLRESKNNSESGDVSGVSEVEETTIKNTIEVFIDNYNTDFDKLKDISTFNLTKYGNGVFDKGSISISKISKGSDKYNVIFTIIINSNGFKQTLNFEMSIDFNNIVKDLKIKD